MPILTAMFKLFGILVFLCLVFGLIGCGGSGSGSTQTNSPFAGHWQGNWNSPSTNDSGTASITVATNGSMSGTMHNNTSGNTGSVSGSISNSGQASGSSQYPGYATIGLSGTVTINSQGHLIGNLTQHINGASYPLTFDLQQQ